MAQVCPEPLSVRFPFSAPDPHDVDKRAFDFEDVDHDAREIGIAF
jgi:hypothetical protein